MCHTGHHLFVTSNQSRKEDDPESTLFPEMYHRSVLSLSSCREHTLFTQTLINNESSLPSSCWHEYVGSLLEAGDGVTARRNNGSQMGPWRRRKPTSIVGSCTWSRKGISQPMTAQPLLAWVLQYPPSRESRSWGHKAGDSLLLSPPPWPPT